MNLKLPKDRLSMKTHEIQDFAMEFAKMQHQRTVTELEALFQNPNQRRIALSAIGELKGEVING